VKQNLQFSLYLGGSWKRIAARIKKSTHGQSISVRDRTWKGKSKHHQYYGKQDLGKK